MLTRRSLTAAAVAAATTLGALPAAAGASCAPVPFSDQVQISAVVLTAEFLPGPADATGTLQSPARARVIRYDLGSGPQELGVVTALGARAFVGEGIRPKAGETWRLYGEISSNGSLGTSVCSGSAILPAQPATASMTAGGVTRSLVAATLSGRPHSGSLPAIRLPRSGKVTLRAASPAGDLSASRSVAARLIAPGHPARMLSVAWSGRSSSLTATLPKLKLGKKGATLVVVTREASLAIALRPAT